MYAARIGNITHMTLYAFFKIGYRCDEIMVDHGLKISSQPITGKFQVGGSRRSSCKKFKVEDSFVTEIAVVHLFHATDNVICTVE